MTPYFNSPERIAQLKASATQWLGTPFVPNACIKGAGVSCQKLVGAILAECGHLPPTLRIPDEPMDWGNAHCDSLVEKFMAGQTQLFGEVPLPAYLTALPGDVVGIRYGGCVHHTGLVIGADGQFIHAIRRFGGVRFSHLREPVFMRLVQKIWRPLAVAQ